MTICVDFNQMDGNEIRFLVVLSGVHTKLKHCSICCIWLVVLSCFPYLVLLKVPRLRSGSVECNYIPACTWQQISKFGCMSECVVFCEKCDVHLRPAAPTVTDFAVTDVWAFSHGWKLCVRLWKQVVQNVLAYHIQRTNHSNTMILGHGCCTAYKCTHLLYRWKCNFKIVLSLSLQFPV